jgi:DNA-binding CsgD family transcriptional regulator
MEAKAISPAVLSRLRAGIERNPGAPAAPTVGMLLDEIDRLTATAARQAPPPCPLTDRQLEVVIAAANGEHPKVTARRLGISHTTVHTRREHAYARLGARTAAEAVAVCMAYGWLERERLRLPELPDRPLAVSRDAYLERAALLRDQPGQWHPIARRESRRLAQTTAYRVRSGMLSAFRPRGAYEAQAVRDTGRHIVRARFIGAPDANTTQLTEGAAS